MIIRFWKCRIDYVEKEHPVRNVSTDFLFDAECEEDAVRIGVEQAILLFHKARARFISEVAVSRYFVEWAAVGQEKMVRSGQGVTVFWWTHTNKKPIEDFLNEWERTRKPTSEEAGDEQKK